MEKIKLDNFAKEHPRCKFPEYVSLSENACSEIAQSIQKKFSLTNVTNGVALVRAIDALAKPCEFLTDVGESFHLNEVLSANGIEAADIVYINWYRYDKIDRLKRYDLDVHFYDIWYPNVDDIDIFDASHNWILSIRHDGLLKLLR